MKSLAREGNEVFMKIGAVIVAAGMSTRMKDFKQLMKIGDLSMAERVVLNFQRAGIKEIVMITGYQGKMVEKSLQHYGVTFIRNEDYETTQMFDSAKIGLDYLKDKCDRVLFCPVDVPFFSEMTVEKLLKARGRVVFPIYQERIGHPIRIDSSLIPDILNYQGDRGLKGALDSLSVKPVRLMTDDEGAITDADTQEDYEHLVEIHNSRLMRTEVQVRLVNKKPFFGPETVNLLKLIDNMGSVKEACDKAGISYSKGWTIIHSAEEELGYKIVERQQGGKSGGQALLTLRGHKLLESFIRYEAEVAKVAESLYKKIFAESGLLEKVD